MDTDESNFYWSNANGEMSTVDLLDDEDEGSDNEFASYSLLGEKFDIGSISDGITPESEVARSEVTAHTGTSSSKQAIADGRRERVLIQV
jgi:hypothetical protein